MSRPPAAYSECTDPPSVVLTDKPNALKGEVLKELPPHGDYRRYNHRVYPCRGSLCRAANAKHTQELRNRKKEQ